jgi:dCMP deaminase
VGCVLVLDKRILTTGFNGSPAGQDHCDEIGHLMVDGHCVRTIHAETNAIIQAALHGVSTRGATCYVTHLPCINCTKALINAGVARIVYGEAYRVDDNAMAFWQAARIEVAQHTTECKTAKKLRRWGRQAPDRSGLSLRLRHFRVRRRPERAR